MSNSATDLWSPGDAVPGPLTLPMNVMQRHSFMASYEAERRVSNPDYARCQGLEYHLHSRP